MKKNLIYLLGLLVISTSCEDILKYESSTIILSENAITTEADLGMARNGAYSSFASGDCMGGKAVVVADLMADDGDIRASKLGNFDTKEIFNGETNGQQSTLRNMWSSAYYAIDRANTVIAAIDENWGEEDLSGLTEWKGEMIAMRAIAHFHVLRFFAQPYNIGGDNTGPGVVIRDEYTQIKEGETLDALQSERASIQESYEFITEQLEMAIPLLEGANDKGYLDEETARAFAARAYFFMGNYTKAFEHASYFYDDNANNLEGEGDLQEAHAFSGSPSSKEVIYYILNVSDFQADGASWAYNAIQTNKDSLIMGASVAVEPADTLIALFDTADFRFKELMAYHKTDSSRVYTTKWTFCDADTRIHDPSEEYCVAGPKSIPVISTPEMYLIAGESILSAGFVAPTTLENDEATTNADDYINAIRERAGLDPLTGATLDDYELERRRELCFEGDRLHNLRRLKKDIREGVTFDDPDFILAIPDDEVGGNPLIQLNP